MTPFDDRSDGAADLSPSCVEAVLQCGDTYAFFAEGVDMQREIEHFLLAQHTASSTIAALKDDFATATSAQQTLFVATLCALWRESRTKAANFVILFALCGDCFSVENINARFVLCFVRAFLHMQECAPHASIFISKPVKRFSAPLKAKILDVFATAAAEAANGEDFDVCFRNTYFYKLLLLLDEQLAHHSLRKSLFQRVIVNSTRIAGEDGASIAKYFAAFDVDSAIAADAVSRLVLRSPESLLHNFRLLFGARIAVIVSAALKQQILDCCVANLKSTQPSTVDDCIRLLRALQNEALFVSAPKFGALFADQMVAVETKKALTALVPNAAEYYAEFKRLYARESASDALKGLLFKKMALIACEVAPNQKERQDFEAFAKSQISSAKVQEKRAAVHGLFIYGCTLQTFLYADEMRAAVQALSGSVENFAALIYGCAFLAKCHASDGADTKKLLKVCSVNFVRWIASKVAQLSDESADLLLEIDQSCAMLRTVVTFFNFSKNKQLVEKVSQIVASSDDEFKQKLLAVEASFGFMPASNLRCLAVQCCFEQQLPDLIYYVFACDSYLFKMQKKLFSPKLLNSIDFALVFDFLFRQSPKSLEAFALFLFKVNCSTGISQYADFLFQKPSACFEFPFLLDSFTANFVTYRKMQSHEMFYRLVHFIYANFDCFADKVVLFTINRLICTLKLKSPQQFRSCLFATLGDKTAAVPSDESFSWLSAENFPTTAQAFNLAYPALVVALKRLSNVEAIQPILDYLKQLSISFDDSFINDLVKELIVLSEKHIILQNSIEELLTCFTQQNRASIAKHAPLVQSTLGTFLLREARFSRKAALLLYSSIQEFDDESSFKLWVLLFDDDQHVYAAAKSIWDRASLTLTPAAFTALKCYFMGVTFSLPEACIKAFAASFALFRAEFRNVFFSVLRIYEQYSTIATVIKRQRDEDEKRVVRSHVAAFIVESTRFVAEDALIDALFDFFVAQVLPYADEDDDIVLNFVDTICDALKIANAPFDAIEAHFNRIDASSNCAATITKGKVLMLAGLVRLFPRDSATFDINFKRCCTLVAFPAENVQSAVACYFCDCWSPALMSLVKRDILPQCTAAASSTARRGYAYAFASFVKTLGVRSLGALAFTVFIDANSKTAAEKEGCLFAIELLSFYLQKSFEPFVVHFVPFVLRAFGDGATEVQRACIACTSAVMRTMSSHALELVLPTVLTHLEQHAWRTKCGAAYALGSMSNLAPRLLARHLPLILQRLGDLLQDPHPAVQNSGRTALDSFKSQIKTPEIKAIAADLLATIADPNSIRRTLDAILHTSFAHYLQDSDLSVLLPVLFIGLQRHQTSDVKKKSAQIIGNILKLVERDIIAPYAQTLVRSFVTVLNDTVAEVRSTAAKVIGNMVSMFGDAEFAWLVPTLLAACRRAEMGAAQALAEVLGAIDDGQQFKRILPELLRGCTRQESGSSLAADDVRATFITMFAFLPLTVKQDVYLAHYEAIVQTLMTCLCDDAEALREKALASARLIFRLQAAAAASSQKSSSPEASIVSLIERGLFDDNPKIRASAVQLLADLAPTMPESTEVAAALYLARNDANSAVRTLAFYTWKSVIANSAKVLRDALDALLAKCVRLMNGDGDGVAHEKATCNSPIDANEDGEEAAAFAASDQFVMARNTCTELCVKFPDIVVGRLLDGREACESAGFFRCLLVVLSGGCSKSHIDDESRRIVDVVVRNVNAPEFRKMVDVLRGALGNKKLDALLVPRLVQLCFDAATTATSTPSVSFANVCHVKGCVAHLLARIIEAPCIGTQEVAILREICAHGDVLPYADDVLNRLLAADCRSHIPIASLDAFVRSFAEAVAKSHGVCDAYAEVVAEALERSNGHFEGSMNLALAALFFVHAAPQLSRAALQTTAEALSSAFLRPTTLTPEEATMLMDRFLEALPDDDAFYGAILSALQADAPLIAAHKPPFVSRIVTSVVLRRMFLTSQASSRETLVDLLTIAARCAVISSVVSVVGTLIRLFGDKPSPPLKHKALACICALFDDASYAALLKPFVPQLQRVATKCLTQDEAAASANEAPVSTAAVVLLGHVMRQAPNAAKVDALISELLVAAAAGTASPLYALLGVWIVLQRSGSNVNGEVVALISEHVSKRHFSPFAEAKGAVLAMLVLRSDGQFAWEDVCRLTNDGGALIAATEVFYWTSSTTTMKPQEEEEEARIALLRSAQETFCAVAAAATVETVFYGAFWLLVSNETCPFVNGEAFLRDWLQAFVTAAASDAAVSQHTSAFLQQLKAASHRFASFGVCAAVNATFGDVRFAAEMEADAQTSPPLPFAGQNFMQHLHLKTK